MPNDNNGKPAGVFVAINPETGRPALTGNPDDLKPVNAMLMSAFVAAYSKPKWSHDATASSNQAAKTPSNQATTVADIEAALSKLRGLPPAKWLLVAPDGRVWADADPAALARVAILSAPNPYPMPYAFKNKPKD